MRILDDDTQGLFKKYPVFEASDRPQKWVCSITKHELPTKELESYVASKKFKRAFAVHQLLEKYGEYFEELGENLLGCKLTTKKLARDPADLERHIHGHRFQRALTAENERSRASELVESMEMEFESPKEEDDADQSELVDERPIEEPAKKSGKKGKKRSEGDSQQESVSTSAKRSKK